MSESEMRFGRRTGKAPETSNFTQACTLLSQFLKEKRNLGNPEAKEKLESILPSALSNNYPTNMTGQIRSRSSSDFFHKIVGSGAEDYNKPDLRTTTTQATKQNEIPSVMTIFYSGQVLVFNDLPTEKADEIIAMARKGSSNVSGSISNPVVVETIDLTDPSSPEEKPRADSPVHLAVLKNKPEIVIDINKRNDGEEDYCNHNNNGVISVTKNKTVPQQRPTETANGSDLPIARRNSLHRFLEKRKDRVGTKAPYQVPNRPAIVPPKSDEGSSRGGECSEKQLELKL